jgi:nitrate reductase (cytochrome), electron transfer subunit
MRRQDRARLSVSRLASLTLVIAAATFSSSMLLGQEIVPRLTGAQQPMEAEPAPPLANPVTDDVRKMRAYPEQPPIIPHAIEGYQLSLRTNRCLDCHRRQYTEGSGAPMISITHFIDRQGQMLADVAPRRYFCTTCHVQQTDAKTLVDNGFVDMTTMSPVDDE